MFTLDVSRIRAVAKKHYLDWQNDVLVRLLSDDSFYEIALKYHELYALKCCAILFYVTYLKITLDLPLFFRKFSDCFWPKVLNALLS